MLTRNQYNESWNRFESMLKDDEIKRQGMENNIGI